MLLFLCTFGESTDASEQYEYMNVSSLIKKTADSLRIFSKGVPEPKNIGTRNFEIPERIEFPKKVEIPENFENPATVSRTTLQCCVAAYKICKYTVQFLLPVKLLETQILRIV